VITHRDGPALGYSPNSGVTIMTVDRKAFKDLNKNGELDPYEDWRLTVEERAADLASRMSVEQIAGLMLYSAHQRIPGGGFRGSTYEGKPYPESGQDPWALSDQQKTFLTEDNLRHVLFTSVESPEVAARWNNKAQALVEGIGLGIPANNSSDPRHQAQNDDEFNIGAGGEISRWPNSIGMAATFDPDLVRNFGSIASREYRALGIATALSPQVDLATDPRWYRFSGTFGPDPTLTTDMARAYVDGFQTSGDGGWGKGKRKRYGKALAGRRHRRGGTRRPLRFRKVCRFSRKQPGGSFETLRGRSLQSGRWHGGGLRRHALLHHLYRSGSQRK
jgi:beta-glucosidase